MSKKRKIIIVLFIVLVVLGGFLFFSSKKEVTIPTVNKNIVSEQNLNTQKAFLEIDNQKVESVIGGSINIYSFMSKLRQEGKINFKEKNYIGMGEFIEEINGVKNNGEKNWIYYVNGKKANIGVSNYKLINGDVVSWRYESQY